MALTATLIEQGHNRLRYLLVCDTTGTTVLNITTTGGASPDLVTDSLAGPVKTCALAVANGLGKLAAGTKTQAQARAIWLMDDSLAVLGSKTPRCVPRLDLEVAPANFLIDADVAGFGGLNYPIIVITANNTGQAWLDIESLGAIGL